MPPRSRSSNKDIRQLIRLAEKDNGWTVGFDGNDHLAWFAPGEDRARFRSAATPGDWRAVEGVRQQLRKNGVEVPRGSYTPPKSERVDAAELISTLSTQTFLREGAPGSQSDAEVKAKIKSFKQRTTGNLMGIVGVDPLGDALEGAVSEEFYRRTVPRIKDLEARAQAEEAATQPPTPQEPEVTVTAEPEIEIETKEEKYVCKVTGCGKTFVTFRALGGHMSSHSVQVTDIAAEVRRSLVEILSAPDNTVEVERLNGENDRLVELNNTLADEILGKNAQIADLKAALEVINGVVNLKAVGLDAEALGLSL